MYAVDIASIPLFLIAGAARTCLPIKCSGFLPLTTERNRMASAKGEIYIILKEKIIDGRFVFTFTFSINDSKSPLTIKLPPTKNPSTPDFSQCFKNPASLFSGSLSGSSKTKYAAPFSFIVFNSWL